MLIRDRIKELRRVPASELQPNPKNWRTHPRSQQEALKGLLAEIGYADALLARETPDGGLVLIDGHLRAETTPDAVVPVLILDVDEAEALKILTTLDPLASLAESDAVRLNELLRCVETESAAVGDLLAQLAAGAREVAADEAAPVSGPTLDTKYAIVVNCESEAQQLQLLEQFEMQGLDCRALVV
jgi:ParB-like chromosome segregation protein Spo0J